MTLDILYRDDDIVAVDKPSGLLVHRSWIDKDETRFALQLVRDMLGCYVYPVHRLDKPTSGVLLFALNKTAAAALSETFAAHRVEKTYHAVVRGYIDETGLIDYPLKPLHDKMTDARSDKPAQDALTRYERLATAEIPVAVGRYATARYSLAALHPATGRKHQLRRHMKHIFHPIVGDTKYGRTEHNVLFRERFDAHRLLLSCVSLTFEHPANGRLLNIEAPYDAAFAHVIDTLFA